LKVTKKTNSSGEETSVTYEVLARAVSITPADLAEWISQNNILPPLFDGRDAHASLMERSMELVKFQATENRLEVDTVDMLWNVGRAGVSLALTALKEATPYMNAEILQRVFQKVSFTMLSAVMR
jgi:hypothetical protein